MIVFNGLTVRLRRLLKILLITATLGYSVIKLATFSSVMPTHGDEVDWLYQTEYFNKLITPSRSTVDWQDYEAFVYPALPKYIYGFYLAVRQSDFSKNRAWLVSRCERVSPCYGISLDPFTPYIFLMRQVAIITTVLALITVGFVVWRLTGSVIVSGLGVFLLINNRLFTTVMLRATSDNLLLLFLLLCLASYLVYVESKRYPAFILMSVSTGLAIVSKLTGLLYLVFFPIYLSLLAGLRIISVKKMLLLVTLFMAISAAVWIGHSPTLHSKPYANTRKYITTRYGIMKFIQPKSKSDNLKTLRQRYKVAYCIVFNSACTSRFMLYANNGNLTPWPIWNVTLFLFGLIYAGYLIWAKHNQMFLFLTLFSLVAGVFITTVTPFAWDQYYLPVVISVFFMQMIGIAGVYNLTLQTVSKNVHRQ